MDALNVTKTYFDFEDQSSYAAAFENCKTLFLLRPPQITDIKNVFYPLIQQAKKSGVAHIVFLSVQGAKKNKFIPHHKIESSLQSSGIDYTFLRPAYFMQNFLTSLHRNLVEEHKIFLPAGKAKFTLVDVRDIAQVAHLVIKNPEEYKNQALEITSQDVLTFGEIAAILSDTLNFKVKYHSPGIIRFFRTKRKEGTSRAMVLVMIMLHFLPRFQSSPKSSDKFSQITGNQPTDFRTFVADHKKQLIE